MVATFVIEDGSGKYNSNAYATEAEVDQYHEDYGDPSAWSALTTKQKETAIRKATRWIDTRYNPRWKGVRANGTQNLDWPQSGMTDNDERAIASNDIPNRLKDAVAVMALESLSRDLQPTITKPGSIKRKKSKLGPLESEVEYASAAPDDGPTYPIVEDLLLRYLHPIGRIFLG